MHIFCTLESVYKCHLCIKTIIIWSPQFLSFPVYQPITSFLQVPHYYSAIGASPWKSNIVMEYVFGVQYKHDKT